MSRFSLRALKPDDQPFLWEMLYQAIYVPEGSPTPSREIVHQPPLSWYVEGWGRDGDHGFIAIESNSQAPVGAAWLRLFSSQDKGYGYVDQDIPELTIAVLPSCRGQGVGKSLLERLLSEAEGLYRAISLSVSPQNPAQRLYQTLGFIAVQRSLDAITLLKSWEANPGLAHLPDE